MRVLRTLAPWVSRVALLPIIAIFMMIGSRHLLQPDATAAAQAVAFVTPLGITDFRVGFGAFPVGCAVFLFICLMVRGWMRPGLVFAGLMLSVIVAVRACGMMADASVAASKPLLVDECIVLGITLIGVAAEFYRLAADRHAASG